MKNNILTTLYFLRKVKYFHETNIFFPTQSKKNDGEENEEEKKQVVIILLVSFVVCACSSFSCVLHVLKDLAMR